MAAVATSMSDRTTSRPMTREERKVILASSLGTVFEWYDFYLYGSLAVIIGAQFFSAFDVTTRNVFALLAFAAGFLVRPFGALVFGRIGDLVGRKYTFLITILIMGLSTFIVGILPSYAQIGWIAPVLLIVLRMAQGLALGGEYGGAAVYVAEHAPHGRRGFYTAWIQTTATVGLLLSLLVILVLRLWMGEAGFQRGEGYPIAGWRIPFLLSVVLLAVSVWIRLQMNESPAFQKMKEEGTQSKAPLSEAFGEWKNAKVVIIALLGLVVGQAVVWYTGQFYALFFLQNILKVDLFTANVLIAWSLIIGTPAFIFFGWLSDRIGRKPVILGGCLVAAITFFPLFHALTNVVSPKLDAALSSAKVQVIADPAICGSVFDPVGIRDFTQPCDIARVALARAAIKYQFVPGPAGSAPRVTFNDVDAPILGPSAAVPAVPAAGTSQAVPARPAVNAINANIAGFNSAATKVGYPTTNDPTILKADGFFTVLGQTAGLKAIGILTVLVLYVTAVYGPIAAALVEFFPTRIRYTAMSLPYHIANGWFGGLLPPTAFAMVAATGDIYYGLWYPVIFALATFVIGLLFVPETKDRDILTYEGAGSRAR